MPLGLANAHAQRIQRDDLVVEAGKAPLILGNQPWIERALPLAGDAQGKTARVRQHRLPAIAIACVCASVSSLTAEVLVQLGIQHPFGQGFLQRVDDAVRIEGCSRVRPVQQSIKKGIRNGSLFAAGYRWTPCVLVFPATHRIPYTPTGIERYFALLLGTNNRLDRAAIFAPRSGSANLSSRDCCFNLRPLSIRQDWHRLSPPTINPTSFRVAASSHETRTGLNPVERGWL